MITGDSIEKVKTSISNEGDVKIEKSKRAGSRTSGVRKRVLKKNRDSVMKVKKKRSGDQQILRDTAVARQVQKMKDKVPLPMVTAYSWAVYDAKSTNGSLQLIHGKKETDRREVASMTKMMTFYASYMIF